MVCSGCESKLIYTFSKDRSPEAKTNQVKIGIKFQKLSSIGQELLREKQEEIANARKENNQKIKNDLEKEDAGRRPESGVNSGGDVLCND